ncbi:hypothetical protein SPRG_15825 [Saprolegnia parasitica CBS 223.65]|uniref:GH16 domain-containing protein n=1 Tax=Saprolegnia parasitica (strain CBS 223.65) TaxID=695850 RepID=A0A067BWB9_SAPPC|nr:hypothetical protein SPRG_15825 [Saprolegnia parasitica CBS 223.65]KDO18902.1 hypothetical protein SPRG_15825 [Saprolegnia parasitica CBS 223.65]|eukprot:XP_012210395.1 hypothetical protein SPRG_15825 [Saprolegnia parasitica CBS 223.65]
MAQRLRRLAMALGFFLHSSVVSVAGQPQYRVESADMLPSSSLVTFPFLPAALLQGETLSNLSLRAHAPLSMALNVSTHVDANATFRMTPSVVNCSSVTTQTFALRVDASSNTTGNYTLTFYDVATASVLYTTYMLVVPPPFVASVTAPSWTGNAIWNDSFDAQPWGAVPNASTSIWANISQGFVSDTCTPGGKALYFTHLFARYAATSPIDVLGFDLQLAFTYVYGFLPNQTYDSVGNNTLSCVQTNPNSPFNVEYRAANDTAWHVITVVPVPPTPTPARQTVRLSLPPTASSNASSFRWIQANQTSGRLGSIRGTRYQWQYRNLFDQWAIDDVVLRGRVQAPLATTPAQVGVDAISVQLQANATDSVILTTIGDGSHAFPVCDFTALPLSTTTVVLTTTSIIHAVTCVRPNQQSYGYRSPRYVVQALPPILVSTKATDAMGYYTVQATMPRPNMTLRFTFGNGSDVPSCTFGHAIVLTANATTTSMVLKSNGVLQAVACMRGLVGSTVVRPPAFVVQPPPPTLAWVHATSISESALFPVTMTTTSTDASLVVVVVDANDTTTRPSCPLTVAHATNATSVTLRPGQLVRAVSCCVTTVCNDSATSVLGPVVASAAPPTFTSQCSTTAMVTSVVTLTPGTTTGVIKYAVNSEAVDCTSRGTLYNGPFPVAKPAGGAAVVVTAITCVPGLLPSTALVVTVPVANCCANAIWFPSADPTLDCSSMTLFRDDFVNCNLSQWTPATTQFGGATINGGVHASNVQCAFDATLNRSVLVLSAHGDAYTGTSPEGVTVAANGSVVPRLATALFSGWALPGSPPFFPCNPRVEPCASKRVGASVSTTAQWNAGIASFLVQPCTAFGTSSDAWLRNVSDIVVDVDASYVAYADLWRASLGQERSPPPFPHAVFSHLRTDTAYHRVFLQFNATEGRANLYRDGQLVGKTRRLPVTTNPSALTLNLWFPNAWAGLPQFESCTTNVADVQVVQLEAAANRWCEFEQATVACSSDAECLGWTSMHCLMPLAVAVCRDRQCRFQMDATFGAAAIKAGNLFLTTV